MNIICLDTETTGLNHYDDEILQLSIIDGSGAILFSEYVKPVEVVPIPKSGNILIGFGIFMLLGFFVAFNPVCIVIAAPLLYFGFKRHKAYKEFKQNKRKQ